MSRAYRISVKESLTRQLEVKDGISSTLELLPILPKEQMQELLAAELARRGFVRDGARCRRKEAGGVTVDIDVATGELSVTAEGHEEASVTAERVVLVDNREAKEREAALRDEARRSLDERLEAEQEELRRSVTRRLEGRLKDLKGELDEVVNQVTAGALKQRAGELGQVEDVHEDGQGNLTIRVRL